MGSARLLGTIAQCLHASAATELDKWDRTSR